MKPPRIMNTLLSCVSCVHAASWAVLPNTEYLRGEQLQLATVDTAVLVDVVDERLADRRRSRRRRS